MDVSSVPLIGVAVELAGRGMVTGGGKANSRYGREEMRVEESVPGPLVSLLFDPQTAGGMLIAIEPARAGALLDRLQETYPAAAVIGRVSERGDALVVVNNT